MNTSLVCRCPRLVIRIPLLACGHSPLSKSMTIFTAIASVFPLSLPQQRISFSSPASTNSRCHGSSCMRIFCSKSSSIIKFWRQNFKCLERKKERYYINMTFYYYYCPPPLLASSYLVSNIGKNRSISPSAIPREGQNAGRFVLPRAAAKRGEPAAAGEQRRKSGQNSVLYQCYSSVIAVLYQCYSSV